MERESGFEGVDLKVVVFFGEIMDSIFVLFSELMIMVSNFIFVFGSSL